MKANKIFLVIFILLFFLSYSFAASRIQIRRDTAANWTVANPTLSQGEFGYETDTSKLKIGDGATAWNALAYYSTGGLVWADLNAHLVPYIGADYDVNLGTFNIKAFGSDTNFNAIYANNFFGNGSGLTGVTATTNWNDVNAHLVPYIGADYDLNMGIYKIKASDSNFTKIKTDWLFGYNGLFGQYVTIGNGLNMETGLGIGDLNVQDNIYSSDIKTNSLTCKYDANFSRIESDFFFGDGSGLTGVVASSSTPDTALDTNASAQNWFWNEINALLPIQDANLWRYIPSEQDIDANCQAIDTNAMTACDGNTVLTGAGDCVVITGFHETGASEGDANHTLNTAVPGNTFLTNVNVTRDLNAVTINATGDLNIYDGTNYCTYDISKGSLGCGGELTTAAGAKSVAFGQWNQANGAYSSALWGFGNTATGDYSLVGGNSCEATQNYAICMGLNSEASGESSIALGTASKAIGSYSIAIGNGVVNTVASSVALGIDANVQRDLWVGRDLNANNIGFSGYIFGDGSKLTGISGTDTDTIRSYSGTAPISVNNDTNTIAVIADFNYVIEYIAQALDTNAMTACDGNLVATGAGDCVDITEFYIDTTGGSTVDTTLDTNASAQNWFWNEINALLPIQDANLWRYIPSEIDIDDNAIQWDTNSNTECDANTVLTGNGICQDITGFHETGASTGDANHTADTAVPGNTFLTNVNVTKDLNAATIRATGDSNFTNIGISITTFSTHANITKDLNVIGIVLVGESSLVSDFPNTKGIFSQGIPSTGYTYSDNIGLVGAAVAATGQPAIGIEGIAKINAAFPAYGIIGRALVDATGSAGGAIGVEGISTETHAGGSNIGIYSNASGGLLNYSFYGLAGKMFNTEDINTLASLSVSENAFFKNASVSKDLNVQGDLNVTGFDTNFTNIGFSGFIFGDGSKLTGISGTDTDTIRTYTGTAPIAVDNDTNKISVITDFNYVIEYIAQGIDTNGNTECDNNTVLTGNGVCENIGEFYKVGGSGTDTDTIRTYTSGSTPIIVNNDANTISLVTDFNSWYESVFDLNTFYYKKSDINGNWCSYLDLNNFYYKKEDINGNFVSKLDFNIVVEYIAQAIDTNSNTECDNNTVLTGNGTCQDITGFHLTGGAGETTYLSLPWADANVADNITLTNITQITNRDITNIQGANDWMVYYSNTTGIQELAFGDQSGKYLKSNGEAALTWDTPAGDANHTLHTAMPGNTFLVNAVCTKDFNVNTIRATGDSNFANMAMTGNLFANNLVAAMDLNVTRTARISVDLNVSKNAAFDANVYIGVGGPRIDFNGTSFNIGW